MAILEHAGVRLWWSTEGAGEPVLLIHGLGYHSEMWRELVRPLSSRWRTVRFDNRGVGRSTVPTEPFSVEDMAGDAVAVLDAAGVRRAHVFGVSLGGVIAQELALEYPERVRSLVLGCTHPGGPQSAPFAPDALELLADRTNMSPAEAARAAVPFVYAPTTPADRIAADLALRAEWPTDPAGYAGQLAASTTYRGSYARLGRLRVPTLVLHGTADRLVNPENARILAAAIPGARLELLPGASHLFYADSPERSLEVITAFLTEVDQSGVQPVTA